MPDPIAKVTAKNIIYTVPISDGMINVYTQILERREIIANLKHDLNTNISELEQLNNQLLAMYIQINGSFPP